MGRALSYSYCHTQAIWASTRLASTTARPSREGRVGPDRVLPANSFTSTYPDAPQETLADQGQTSTQDCVTPPAENDEVFDPVETQYLTVRNTLDTLLQKRLSPTAMVGASHAALGAERL